MGSRCLNAYADSSDKHDFCRGSDCTGTFCESWKTMCSKQLTMNERKCYQYLSKKTNHTQKQDYDTFVKKNSSTKNGIFKKYRITAILQEYTGVLLLDLVIQEKQYLKNYVCLIIMDQNMITIWS